MSDEIMNVGIYEKAFGNEWGKTAFGVWEMRLARGSALGGQNSIHWGIIDLIRQNVGANGET